MAYNLFNKIWYTLQADLAASIQYMCTFCMSLQNDQYKGKLAYLKYLYTSQNRAFSPNNLYSVHTGVLKYMHKIK